MSGAVAIIIPALNEEASIESVVRSIPNPPVRHIIVVDNGSTDRTAALARGVLATVVQEPRRGYGSACLAGIRALPSDVDVVVFMDADGSDDASQLRALVTPIEEGRADLVVGARRPIEAGALTPQQRVGNAVAAWWLRARFGIAATDLGPFRAIRRSSLLRLGMRDPDYGWTVEMQIRAARIGLGYEEIVVPYRRRIGRSKISGTFKGTLLASFKILGLLARYDLLQSTRLGRAWGYR
ncbi:MAG: glycosyltransferase family 2 protein [Deltaproteobacteria bacterium]|nr:glycosyltransferase family 2 protein [Deltaproteobacteria bacterium]